MANPDWTLISGDASAHDTLKSKSYCNLTTTEFDAGLALRGQAVTAKMIRYLNSPTWIDITKPPADLVEACLTQVTYEHRQRETPGLSTVTFKDGTINKMGIDGMWLKQVKDVLDHYRRRTIVETSSQFS